MPDPKFKWSAKRRQYIYNNGKPVSAETLNGWVATAADNAEQRMRAIAQKYVDGKINHAEWVIQSKDEIRKGVRGMAQLAAGGTLDKKQVATMANIVKKQYGFFRDFSNGVDNGEILLDGNLVARAGLYGSNHYTVFQNLVLSREKAAGVKMAIRRLSPVREHCPECPGHQRLTPTPINKITPIGVNCSCRARCRCSIISI